MNERRRVVRHVRIQHRHLLRICRWAPAHALHIRHARSLEYRPSSNRVDLQPFERMHALALLRLERQEVRHAPARLREPLLDVRSETNHRGVPSGNLFAPAIGGKVHNVDLAVCPDDDAVIRWGECEGGVGAHRGGNGAQVVRETVPCIVKGSCFEVSALHCHVIHGEESG